MHEEILNADQQKLLPLMAQFRREYYLVGGTAIALHLGHRRSIDFDMFKMAAISHKKNLDKIVAAGFEHLVTRRVEEQMNLLVGGVKVTFFQYPFSVVPEDNFKDVFRLPSLLSLAAETHASWVLREVTCSGLMMRDPSVREDWKESA